MNKIIIALLVLMMSSCAKNHPADLIPKKSDAKSIIETVTIEKSTISSFIKLPGQLKPFEKVDIYPKINGFVKEMYVDRGSTVNKGQVLMVLEAPEIVQQIQAAQAKLEQSRQNLIASRDRYHRLQAAAKVPGSISELDLMNAVSKYQSDSALEQSEKANLTAAQVLQDYLVIKAPFNGVITERNIHPGSLTGPNFKMDNKPLLVLQNNTMLRMEVFIPEVYTGNMDKNAQQISFTTQSLPGQTFTATLARSSNSLYDEYRSEAIEADIPNTNAIFKPGMYIEATMKIKSSVTSYETPSSTIVTSTEGKYVVSVKNGKTKYINIREGIANKGKTEIFGDLKGDEVLLKNPSNETKEGVAIK